MQRRSIFMGVAAAVMVSVVAGAADAQKALKFGSVFRPGLPSGDAVIAMEKHVNKISDGKLIIEPHFRGSLCSEQKCGEQANQGLLQLWTSSTANFGNFAPTLTIFDLPFLFKDLNAANDLSGGWLGAAQAEEAKNTTEHFIFEVFASGGFRHLGNAAKPFRKPSDMKGIKMRVTKSPVEYTLIKTWGAIPVPFDWAQLYQGLQTGVVQGQYVQVPWQYVYKMYEVQKYYTEVGGAWGGNHISADLKQYNSLTDQEKKWLRAGMDVFSKDARAGDNEWVKEGIAAIKKEIDEWYVPTAAEMDLWRAGAVGAWAKAKGTYNGKLAQRALEEQGLGSFVKALQKGGAL